MNQYLTNGDVSDGDIRQWFKEAGERYVEQTRTARNAARFIPAAAVVFLYEGEDGRALGVLTTLDPTIKPAREMFTRMFDDGKRALKHGHVTKY